MAIKNSIRNVYPGMGSPGSSFVQNDVAAASGASTLTCTMPSPVQHGKVRVKTEAAVASFIIVAVLGKTNVGPTGLPLGTPDTIVLYHGDIATAIPGVATAFVDENIDFNGDRPMFEIDILISAGAAVNISYEVVGGS